MRRVLIVDDDPRVRAALTALITATTDLTVAAAVGTTRDVCAALATRSVELILVDVQLPHCDDGITLIQTCSRRYLVVAMSIDGSSRAPAQQAGAADFQEKNGNPDDNLEALHRPLSPGKWSVLVIGRFAAVASDALGARHPRSSDPSRRQRSAGDGSRCCAAHRCLFRSRVPRPPGRCSGLSGALPAW